MVFRGLIERVADDFVRVFPRRTQRVSRFLPSGWTDQLSGLASSFPDRKRKATKISQVPKKNKVRMNLTLDLPQKEGKKQFTLDSWLFQPKVPSRVRFQERVLLKEITPDSESWSTVSLKGFSTPGGFLFQKRQEMRQQIKRKHH